jgi:D-ribose pyranose/furanose isomerase RbsD
MNQHFQIPKQTQLILKVALTKNLPNLPLVLKYLQRGMKVQLRLSILSIT